MRAYLREIKEDSEKYHFHDQGLSASSLKELHLILDALSHDETNSHIWEDGNHFAAWVGDIIGDKELAEDLAPLSNKNHISKALQHRIFMIDVMHPERSGVEPKIEPVLPTALKKIKRKKPSKNASRARNTIKKTLVKTKKKRVVKKNKTLGKATANGKQAKISEEPHDFNTYKQNLIDRLLKSADPTLKKRIRKFQKKR